MFSKYFTFSHLTLLVALAISVIAAYYSIIGLTAIYAGAFIPIIVMGSILEVGKVTATVWLRKYWSRCGLLIKLYLVPAVVLLAFITSMGIFGFLSRAHIEQGAPIGDSVEQIKILDERIEIEQEVIEQYRRDLVILNQQIERFSELGAVSRGVTARAAQQEERQAIFNRIEQSQQVITDLRQQRAPLNANIRKIEAEVGPIKYIAAIIYGDNPDQNLLERAVRWVTILLVLVFDPLALVLILAANQSKEWDKEDLLNQEKTKFTEDKPPVLDEDKIPEESEPNPIIVELPEEPTVAKPDPHPPGWMFSPLRNDAAILKQFEKETITSIEVTPEEEDFFREQEKEVSVIPVEPTTQVATETIIVNTEPTIEEQMADTVDIILSKPEKRYQVLEGGYIEVDGKLTHIINLDSEMMLKVDGLPSKTGFGTAFPKYADVGNVFVRVDNLPHKVFK